MLHGSKASGFVLFVGNLSFYLAFAFATISWGGWDTLGQLAQAGWVRAREPCSLLSIPPSHPICSNISGLETASLHFLLLPSPHISLESAPKAGKTPLAHPPTPGESFPKVRGLQTPFPLHGHCLSLSLLQIQAWSPQPCALDRFPGSRQKGQGDSRGPSWLPARTAERGSQEARFIPKNKASGDFPRCSWYFFLSFFFFSFPPTLIFQTLCWNRGVPCHYQWKYCFHSLPGLCTLLWHFFFCLWIYASLTFSYLRRLERIIYLWGCCTWLFFL